MKKLPLLAKIYICLIASAGLSILLFQFARFHTEDPARFAWYVAVAAFASSLKVRLPGIHGTLSVNFLFILLGVIELGLPETLVIGCVGILIQCVWHTATRPKPVQILFNVTASAIGTAGAYTVYHSRFAAHIHGVPQLLLLIAASVYFLVNTMSIAGVISLADHRRLKTIWHDCYFWAFPYYLIGGTIAGAISAWNQQMHWRTSIAILPAVYFIYRSARLYLDRLRDEKKHVEEMAALHLRTIESLALAIEAKDLTTHDHLRRVSVYAVEIGRELGLSAEEIEAVRAAALLHDIGKLAVPEHIIAKPGKLTPEEYEKMKIHTIVGAEILERVQFPYPVVPIVRSHHENWDGTGYPDGLRGAEIPIGARILAVVDRLDAVASDRQYRRALPLEDAMALIESDAGRVFDPKVVEVLKRRYRELEPRAQAEMLEKSRLSTDVKITKGSAPAAGFETAPEHFLHPSPMPALSSIAAARQEAQMLFELTQDLGSSLSLDETLSVIAARLKRLIPHDSFAIYIARGSTLIPAHVSGEDYRLFSSLEIPVGEGLSGWVAEHRKPLWNGNPTVEAGYLNDSLKFSTLRSALAVPLEGVSGLVGVLTLYKAQKDGFNRDHLRVLLAISSKMSLAIENALKYRQAENSATTDYLTNLPNARSLFVRLDSELARCRRERQSLCVLVGDLDGFKSLNDRFGHLTGNKVLRMVADALQSACRQYDYVARMGGDEFVMVLPGLPFGAVVETMARLREMAAEVSEGVCGARIISMSVGAAAFPDDGADADQLLAEADRRMYKAKQANKRRAGVGFEVIEKAPALVMEPAVQ